MASRIQIAKPDIVKRFEALPHVLKASDVARVFNKERAFWRLTNSTSLSSFIRFMREKTALREVRYTFPQRDITGYVWGDVPLLEILLGLVDDSFYSHYTAVRIHGLTEQVPKTIFLNHEKSSNSIGYSSHSELFDQAAIDAAFSKPPRASKNESATEDVRIIFLESAYHSSIGITTSAVNFGGDRDLNIRHTNLERTLIDIVVRPFYAGGVFEVAKAFEHAKDKGVSINTLSSMLKRMGFGYPYHQAIGFYLERANFKSSLVDIFRKMPRERDFYITHQMGKTRYISEWRLYVPEGF